MSFIKLGVRTRGGMKASRSSFHLIPQRRATCTAELCADAETLRLALAGRCECSEIPAILPRLAPFKCPVFEKFTTGAVAVFRHDPASPTSPPAALSWGLPHMIPVTPGLGSAVEGQGVARVGAAYRPSDRSSFCAWKRSLHTVNRRWSSALRRSRGLWRGENPRWSPFIDTFQPRGTVNVMWPRE